MKDLKTSTGGIAPYCYSAGMFVSSIAIILIFPLTVPKRFFLILSSLDYTDDWSWEWDVVEVRIKGDESILSNWILFPVPDGPVIRTG